MRKPISRRAVLRGAGGVSIGLPFLEAMLPARATHAAGASLPKRFIAFYSPGGIYDQWWTPTGSETNFDLGASVLSPLTRYKQQIIVLEGLENKVSKEGYGNEHSRGMSAFLTGTPLLPGTFETQAKGVGNFAGFASGPSLDQVLGRRIGADSKFKSIQLGVRWPSFVDPDFPAVGPYTILSYEDADKPVAPAADPQAVFTRLFSDVVTPTEAPQLAAERMADRSILDVVGRQYTSLARRLGRADSAKLDAHLSKIREIETRLAAPLQPATSCQKPGVPARLDHNSDENIPVVAKLMIDMLVAALACDVTRVGLLQLMESGAHQSYPWLGLKEECHNTYEHGWWETRPAYQNIWRWYAEQFAYLVGKLMEAQEGGQSLLDNTVVYWGTELGDSPSGHSQTNMPAVLAGSAGGAFRTGRWVKCSGQPNNNVLVSLQNAFGIDSPTFGKAAYCTGPLPNLT